MFCKRIIYIVLIVLSCDFLAKEQIKKPIFIFVHGIFDSKKQAEKYKAILGASVIGFDFDDALLFPLLHKPFITCFGQEAEIEQVEKIYDKVVHFFESKNMMVPPIILVGLSRGASTILNFLAIKQPKYIKGAILESPFDHLEYVLEYGFGKTIISRIVRSLFYYIFPYYNKNGIQPVHMIKKINKNTPLLFITSLQDQRVPYHSVMMLHRLLQQNNHKKLFLKIFNIGRHAKILGNNIVEYKATIKEFLHQI
jgi:hypothetical protein